jgi:hypothetical protein
VKKVDRFGAEGKLELRQNWELGFATTNIGYLVRNFTFR